MKSMKSAQSVIFEKLVGLNFL